MQVITSIEGANALVGQELGVSDWLEIDHSRSVQLEICGSPGSVGEPQLPSKPELEEGEAEDEPDEEAGPEAGNAARDEAGLDDGDDQRAEHRAGIRALQAFHPDVLEDEGLDREGRKGGQRSRQQRSHEGRLEPIRVQHGKLHRVSVHAQQAGEIVVEGQ